MDIDFVHQLIPLVLLAIVTHWFACRAGFYHLPPSSPLPVAGKHVAVLFVIYWLGILCAPLVTTIETSLFPNVEEDLFPMVGLLRFLILGIGLLAYGRFMGKKLFIQIWKKSPKASWIKDCAIGFLLYWVSFPVVAIVLQCLNLLFDAGDYDQVAVQYLLKTRFPDMDFFSTLFLLVVLSPIVEEFVFRGILQNYLKQKVSRRGAIVITAACFAITHFASSQGPGNLSLIPALFVLACFLGILYEKRESLYAPITLHITFNAMSVLQLILSIC